MWESPARRAGVVEQLEAVVGAALGCAVVGVPAAVCPDWVMRGRVRLFRGRCVVLGK